MKLRLFFKRFEIDREEGDGPPRFIRAGDLDGVALGGDAVAAPAVDGRLGGPQPADREAALPGVVEVAAHELAQDAATPDKPLLWKIEGNPLEKPSYLFGTIHLTTPRIEKLHPAAQKAFDAAERLRP